MSSEWKPESETGTMCQLLGHRAVSRCQCQMRAPKTPHDPPQESEEIHNQKENAMPLLEVTQIRHISALVRLTDTTAAQVDQYAAFIEASADAVIEQALTYVFSKDRDFQKFLKSSQAVSVIPTLRIRKDTGNEAAEPSE